MGGGYYDRDVQSAANNAPDDDGYEYSLEAASALSSQTSLHKSMDPKRWAEEKLLCTAKHPIVVAIDVTGSMGSWVKMIYDKMPMFYGQILVQGYLSDPAIGIAGVGDHTCDKAPLQIAEFGQGKELDQILPRLWLEGGGGCSGEESYELAAYFYSRHCELKGAELPFFFISADEQMYELIEQDALKKIFGQQVLEQAVLTTMDIWAELKKKFNVFLLHKENYVNDAPVKKQWLTAVGQERMLNIQDPKACVDVMLGVIALTSGKRTLQEYIVDMEDRGQSAQRVKEVTEALFPYANYMSAHNIVRGVQGFEDQKQEEEKKQGIEEIRAQIKELMKQYHIHQPTEEELRLKEFEKQQRNKVPDEYVCPLTMEMFVDPVTTEDGQTYERRAIETWFSQGNMKSPLSGVQLQSKNLIPNAALKKLIHDWVEKRRQEEND